MRLCRIVKIYKLLILQYFLIINFKVTIMASNNITTSYPANTSSYDHNFLTLNTAAKIKTIRRALQLSQAAFAALLQVSVKTLQDWEQARRKPSRSARSLFLIAEQHPEIFKKLPKNNY